MSVLSGKKILLGISGSIAAYKTPDLVRKLIKKGIKLSQKVIGIPFNRFKKSRLFFIQVR